MKTIYAALIGMTILGALAPLGLSTQTLSTPDGVHEGWYVCEDSGLVPSPHEGHSMCVQVAPLDGNFMHPRCVE